MTWFVTWNWRQRIPNNRTYNVQKMHNRVAKKGRQITKKLRSDQRKVFSYGGHQRHGGRPWKRLAKSTIERKGHDTILVETGHMRRRQSTKGRFRLEGRTITVRIRMRNNAPYAKWHQEGYVHPKAGVVSARPPNVLTGKDKRAVKEGIKRLIPPPKGGKGKRRRRR